METYISVVLLQVFFDPLEFCCEIDIHGHVDHVFIPEVNAPQVSFESIIR